MSKSSKMSCRPFENDESRAGDTPKTDKIVGRPYQPPVAPVELLVKVGADDGDRQRQDEDPREGGEDRDHLARDGDRENVAVALRRERLHAPIPAGGRGGGIKGRADLGKWVIGWGGIQREERESKKWREERWFGQRMKGIAREPGRVGAEGEFEGREAGSAGLIAHDPGRVPQLR
eukprot:6177756-Pleurochrysis_carterae.AAC.1